MLPRSNSFPLPPASPRCAAALGAATSRRTNWSLDGWAVLRGGDDGREPGNGRERRTADEYSRLARPPNRLVSPGRLVGRLRIKGGRYTVDAITRVPLPHSPGKQDSTRIAWPRGVPTVTIYDGAIVTLCICVN